MSIAKITGEGLASIAFAVAILWGCIVVENSMTKDARRQTARVLLDLQKLKNGGKAIPASQPVRSPGFSRPVVG